MIEADKQKLCVRCETFRDISKFRLLPPKLLSSGIIKRYISNICTPCIVKRNKEARQKDQSYYNEQAKQRRFERKKRAIQYKGNVCNSCKESVHPAAFDFHHIDATEKETDPGLMMGLADKKLFKELDKCILLCANCHRILHYEQGDLGKIKIGKRRS